MSTVVPTSRGEWRLPHDGAFLVLVALGSGTVLKFVAPLLAGVGAVAGFLLGIVALAGHRRGYVPTKLLVGSAGVGVVSVLAFVAFVLYWVFFGGLCCS